MIKISNTCYPEFIFTRLMYVCMLANIENTALVEPLLSQHIRYLAKFQNKRGVDTPLCKTKCVSLLQIEVKAAS